MLLLRVLLIEGASVEGYWNVLEGTLLGATDRICGCTKCPARHKETQWDDNASNSFTVMYPEFFWADWYILRTHKVATLGGVEQEKFQNLYLLMLKKYTLLALPVVSFLCKLFSSWIIFKEFIYS